MWETNGQTGQGIRLLKEIIFCQKAGRNIGTKREKPSGRVRSLQRRKDIPTADARRRGLILAGAPGAAGAEIIARLMYRRMWGRRQCIVTLLFTVQTAGSGMICPGHVPGAGSIR